MERIGVDPVGIAIMAPKQLHLNLKVDGLTPTQANIIKQDMLAIGGEAAVSRGAVSCSVERTGAVVSGTVKQLKRLAAKLRGQTNGIDEIAASMAGAVENALRREYLLKGVSREWRLGGRTLVMGILNTTPDSFYDGGRYVESERAIERGIEMTAQGADIIDVGGESTRPGAEAVPEDEELKRVLPVVEGLCRQGLAVSIDTTKAAVARAALEAGAEMVNDVSAMEADPEMPGVVARYKAAVVLMHKRGTPATMQRDVEYEDLMGTVFTYLHSRLEGAAEAGIEPGRIVVDPGIGFGKSAEGNMEIIGRLPELKSLGRPILVGASRKSFIAKAVAPATEAACEATLYGTLSAGAAAILNGASMLRVHDVREARMGADMADAIKGAG